MGTLFYDYGKITDRSFYMNGIALNSTKCSLAWGTTTLTTTDGEGYTLDLSLTMMRPVIGVDNTNGDYRLLYK